MLAQGMGRRGFLRAAVLCGGSLALGLSGCSGAPTASEPTPEPDRPWGPEPVSVKDPSLVPGAVAGAGASPEVNRLAFQAALAMGIREVRPVLVPADEYLLSGDVLIDGRARLVLEPGAVVMLRDGALLEHGRRNNQDTAHAAAVFWLSPRASRTELELHGVIDANADRQGADEGGVPYAPNCVFIDRATGVRMTGDWEARRGAAGVFAIDADDSLIQGVSGRVPSLVWTRGGLIALEGCRRAVVRGIRAEGTGEAVDLNNANRDVLVEDVVAVGTGEGIDINGSTGSIIRNVSLRNCRRAILETGGTGARHTRRDAESGPSTFEGIDIVMDSEYPHVQGPSRAAFDSEVPSAGVDVRIRIERLKPQFNPAILLNFGLRGGEARVVVDTDRGAAFDLVQVWVDGGTIIPEIRSPVPTGRAMVRIMEGSRNVRVENVLLEQPASASPAGRIGIDVRATQGAVVSGCRAITGVQTPVALGAQTVLDSACTAG